MPIYSISAYLNRLFLALIFLGGLNVHARSANTENQAPVVSAGSDTSITLIANAGKDTTIFKNQTRPDSAFLDGRSSMGSATYRWEFVSGPAIPAIHTPDSMTSWVTGIAEGVYQFRLTLNNTASDTMLVFVRDWQKKGVYPCRPGYDTLAKKGGQKITLEPNYKGTYIKPDGTSGTWNQWNYILSVRAYIESTKKITLYGGDTLLMQGADSTVWVELGGFGGDKGCPVYVMPKTKPVRIRGKSSFFRIATRDSNVVQHVVVDGTVLRETGYPYGFVLDNSNLGYTSNGPFNGGWLANFTLKGLRSTKTNALKIKLDPSAYMFSRYDKFVQKNIIITDNWIDSSSVEGMYIGSTASDGGQLNNPYGPPPRMEGIEISNNIVTNSAWDGIQLANAKNGCIIKHNLVYKAGTANMPSQRAGILMGGNTTGVVDSNLIINSKGNGIQVFGYGNVNVSHNIIDSIYGGKGDQDGIYQSFIVFTSEPSVAPLRVYNYNNLISRAERNMIRIANNNGKMLPGHTHHNTFIHATATSANSLIVTNAKDVLDNNSLIRSFSYKLNSINSQDAGTAIVMAQGDTTQTFPTVKATLEWLFKRLNGVSVSNLPPKVDAGSDIKISLPTDSVVLQGSATDEDGSITTYQWVNLSGPAAVQFETTNQPHARISGLVSGVYQFELTATDNGNKSGKDSVFVTVNAPPVVDAGSDTTITLPVNAMLLRGKAIDPDGSITSIKWTKVSGPANFRFQNAGQLQTLFESLQNGVYVLELTVTDNENSIAKDTIVVKVNLPPDVNAGYNLEIQLPVDSVFLQGTATDPDGIIAGKQWRKVSGPDSYIIEHEDQARTKVGSLVPGSYLFEWSAIDNDSARIADTVGVEVKPALNAKPIANAGADTILNWPVSTLQLQGTGTDVDGAISGYQWTQVSGVKQATIATPQLQQTTVSGLEKGTYHFELAVTDDKQAVGRDTIKIVVNANPIVSAGPDQSIQLPSHTVNLSGVATDEDGLITTLRWSKVSGPDTYTLSDSLTSRATASNLKEGVYRFEFRAFDERKASAADTVQITVLSAPNVLPTANAGADKTITLPANSVTLSGSGTDADGSIISYNWAKVSGPAQGSISSPAAASTLVTGLLAGSYFFRLTVTDNKGAVASDTVAVTVNSAPVVNKQINVNIYGGTNAYVNSAWNNWSIRTTSVSNVSSAAFKYTDASTSTVSATLSNSSAIADNGSAYGGVMAPAPVLRYVSYYNSNRSLTLKGLSASKTYDIELYASRNVSGSATIFTINGFSRTVETYKNVSNKVVFTGLKANTSGQIVVNISKKGSFNCINGFALIEKAGTTSSSTTKASITSEHNLEQMVMSQDVELAEALDLFPNPVTDYVTVTMTNPYRGILSIRMVSASGQVLKTFKFLKAQQDVTYQLSTAGLPRGLYYMQLQVGVWQRAKRFSKL